MLDVARLMNGGPEVADPLAKVLEFRPRKQEPMRVPKHVGQALAAAGMLGATVETLMKPGVMCSVARAQGAKVLRWKDEAAGEALRNRELPDALRRKVVRHAEAVLACGRRVMPDRLFCPPFVAARLMACQYFLDHHLRQHGMRRGPWRYLEQTSATLLSMLLQDLAEDEADMFAITEEMFLVFQA